MNTVSNYDLKIKKRIQLVHIAASELGLLDAKKHNTDPDDEYHTILARWNRPGTRPVRGSAEAGHDNASNGAGQPVTSSLQMNYEQLGELLDFFKALGFKLKKKPSPSSASSVYAQRSRVEPRVQGTPSTVKKDSWKKYDSSLQGLKDEICDLAKARWGRPSPGPSPAGGEDQVDKDNSGCWELPLNNFCQRFGVKRWQWLDVAHGKEVKAALIRLQSTDDRRQTEPEDEEPIPF